ncbi:MAG TPA: CAP domain-containing protein [Polyangiaceae bacterium]|nr:CAP domain-containing protein [Polyangiaceae bacterium]
MKRIKSACVILSIGLLLAACQRVPPAPFGAGLPKVAATPQVREMEHAMFQRVNADRRAHGLAALRYDERLADVGRYHSQDMRDHKFFEHDSPTTGSLDNRLNRAGYLFSLARENLSEAPDVQTSEDGLLKSPGHFANIMSPDVTHIGVGIVQGGVLDGRNFLFTQVFAKPTVQETPAAAQRSILQQLNQRRAAQQLPALTAHPLLTKLAMAHIAEVDPNDGGRSLGRVGEEISKEVAAQKNTGFSGVLLMGQLLVDSSTVEVPAVLLQSGSHIGLAVRRAPNEIGRPMLQVLFVIASGR